MVDLSKTIKLNKHYEITYGRILIMSIITLFQVLAILCLNNWVLVPEVFLTIANSFFLLSKRQIDEELDDLKKEVEENKKLIQEQSENINKLAEKFLEGDNC